MKNDELNHLINTLTIFMSRLKISSTSEVQHVKYLIEMYEINYMVKI
jgi:hypothetical protein